MPSYIPLNFEQQQLNDLGTIGVQQRGVLIPTNDYFQTNQYNATHPDALATGDAQGKGTGNFLDVYNQNAGTITDRFERKDDLKINKFSPQNPYYNVT